MKIKALVKRPGESFKIIEGIKDTLDWVHKDGNIENLDHLMIGNYCFLFDDIGAINYIAGRVKYNCNLVNDYNLIFGNLYVTKVDEHGEDTDILEEDLFDIAINVFVLNEKEAHDITMKLWKKYGPNLDV